MLGSSDGEAVTTPELGETYRGIRDEHVARMLALRFGDDAEPDLLAQMDAAFARTYGPPVRSHPLISNARHSSHFPACSQKRALAHNPSNSTTQMR